VISGKELRAKSRYLREQNRKYSFVMSSVSRELWPSFSKSMTPEAVWRSCLFLAQVFPAKDGARRISICRTELDLNGNWRADISWDDLQQIKNECGYSEFWAVEIFPPVSAVVNVANMRHLWVTHKPDFAWVGSAKAADEKGAA
jgi:hypothetical protein